MKVTAGEVSQKFRAQLVGDADFLIEGVADPATAGPGSVCFVASVDYLSDVRQSPAQCWVIDPKLFNSLDQDLKKEKNFLLAEKPYYFFIQLVALFFPNRAVKPGIHPKAAIDPTAEVHPSAQVEAFVSVGPRAKIGAHCVLHAGVWIDEEATVGEGSVLYAGVKVYHQCVIGRRNIIHAGAVIGSDGFGFIKHNGRQEKIPQVGRAILHDDVEVGANSTIDRGTLDDTVIGEGTKIDNLVQVGHNSKIGKHGIFCAFVGISGNTTIGDNVLMAGQSATKGHLKIGDNVMVGGQSGITKDIPSNVAVKGYPARSMQQYMKGHALYLKLPDIYKRLKEVERKVGVDAEGEQP